MSNNKVRYYIKNISSKTIIGYAKNIGIEDEYIFFFEKMTNKEII